MLWAIKESVNLFFEECHKCDNCKNVNKCYINFDDLHMNIFLSASTSTSHQTSTKPMGTLHLGKKMISCQTKRKKENERAMDKMTVTARERTSNSSTTSKFLISKSWMEKHGIRHFKASASTSAQSGTALSCAPIGIPKDTSRRKGASLQRPMFPQEKSQTSHRQSTFSTWHVAGHPLPSTNRELVWGSAAPNHVQLENHPIYHLTHSHQLPSYQWQLSTKHPGLTQSTSTKHPRTVE
jgi:hypothetical protein